MPSTNKLTDQQCRSVQERGKERKLFDGGGLFLHITSAGGRIWRWQYRIGKKQQTLTIGPYPAITLKAAREEAFKHPTLMLFGREHRTLPLRWRGFPHQFFLRGLDARKKDLRSPPGPYRQEEDFPCTPSSQGCLARARQGPIRLTIRQKRDLVHIFRYANVYPLDTHSRQ